MILFAACGGSEGPATTEAPGNADSASTVVGPSGGSVVTPSGVAGVQIPPGVISQSATITITRLPAPAAPGQGPLPTSLNQYGPYYQIAISPANAQLGDSVRVGVCQVTDPSSPFYGQPGVEPGTGNCAATASAPCADNPDFGKEVFQTNPRLLRVAIKVTF